MYVRLFKLHAIVEAGMGIERDAGLGFKLLEAAAKKNTCCPSLFRTILLQRRWG